jgi:hypothetical protein
MVRDTPDVGDIDIVLVTAPRSSWQRKMGNGADRNRKAVEALAKRLIRKWNLPDSIYADWDWAYGAIDQAFKRSLYGERRNPIFSEVIEGTLIDMHRPCKCLFDIKRGGIVDDPTLPHHPKSTGRSGRMLPPRELPVLTQDGPLRPSYGSWLHHYRAAGGLRAPAAVRSWVGSGSLVVCGPDHIPAELASFVRDPERIAQLNGRERVLVAIDPEYSPWSDRANTFVGAAFVDRSVEITGGECQLDVRVEFQGETAVYGARPIDIANGIAALIAADVYRMNKAAVAERVIVSLDCGSDWKAVQLRERIARRLDACPVSITFEKDYPEPLQPMGPFPRPSLALPRLPGR